MFRTLSGQALKVLELSPGLRLVNTIFSPVRWGSKLQGDGITNSALEGSNSVIQLVRSRARGYRNTQNFCAMVYYLGN
jgi:hypothetical protein